MAVRITNSGEVLGQSITGLSEILYDTRWFGNHGIGRFAQEVFRNLPGFARFEASRHPAHPFDPWLLGAALRQAQPRFYFSPGYNSPRGWPGRFVFTLHDLHHLCVPDNSNALKRAYYRHIIRPACHRAEFVLTVSEYSRSQIAEWAGLDEERIVNVGNGVGLPFAPEGPKYHAGFPYFLYVGSRKPHKNLPRLLQAYARTALFKDIRLVVTGGRDENLAREIEGLGLQKAVVSLPSAGNEQLAALYRGAVALLFPSRYEGFGLPPLEAMACGTPVLTSNVCALPEIVGDAGVLVDPLQTDSIAAGILTISGDDELRRSLRAKGLQRARRFTWQRTTAKIAALLQLAMK